MSLADSGMECRWPELSVFWCPLGGHQVSDLRCIAAHIWGISQFGPKQRLSQYRLPHNQATDIECGWRWHTSDRSALSWASFTPNRYFIRG